MENIALRTYFRVFGYTVHDYQSIEITSSLSNSNILDLPPQSPDRTNIKPLHSSTPTRKAGPPKCASPLKIVMTACMVPLVT
jgi:hypothetical protein